MIDLLVDASSANGAPNVDWRNYVTEVPLQPTTLSVMTSGQLSERYPSRVLDFDWTEFFKHSKGGEFIEDLRSQWREKYDFTLIDSRTGITDAGGICTIMLPDIIVPVFVSNLQSLDGVVDVIARAQARRKDLAYDRPPASILPILSRFDSRTEFASAQEWLDLSAVRLEQFYADWLPVKLNARQALEKTKLPYVAYFSFGETLPVLSQGVSDPESLGYALNTISQLIEDKLGNAEVVIGDGNETAAQLDVQRYGPVTAPATPTAEWSWRRQGIWSQVADRLKAVPSRQWVIQLVLPPVAAALAVAGSQLNAVSAAVSGALAAAAAAAMATVGLLLSRQSAEQVRDWMRAWSVSEAIKTEVFMYLGGSGAYYAADRDRRLEAEVQRLEQDADDLLRYTEAVRAPDRSLPPVHDVDSYLEVRVRQSQLRYYEAKARQLRQRLRLLQSAELTLVLVAAVLAAVVAIRPSAGAWVGVVTTAWGAVAAYVASGRRESLWVEYSSTAGVLRRLLDRHTAADGRPLSGSELIAECEQVISAQNLKIFNRGGYSL